ncbi:MAG TPA: ATP-dependent DNA helicase [Caldimonas sp.]|nr:ATP-dependent DNA helicase [Caldimonas sp.]
MKADDAPYTVGVRALCEFTARAGDLDLRFSPSPTALEGLAGHAAISRRRGADYRREVPVVGTHRGLVVRGRADGWDPVAGRLEEIKTHRGDLARQPTDQRHLHWAQAKVYGALLCEALALDRIEIALVYFEIGRETETVLVESHDAASLRTFFEAQCERFVDWALQESAHARARDAAFGALAFPLGELRPGQRTLAEAVWRSARSGRCLVAQAPTGSGKTLGTLFPMLKAWTAGGLDKVWYLTAKGSARPLALEALGQLRAHGATPMRVVELMAREAACVHADKACHPDSCPLARGHHDRMPAARAAALAHAILDGATLRVVGAAHRVCPWHLGHEMVRWADVGVADVHHWFDSHALLHAMTLAHEWRVAVLVDEAHNLLERARAMYTAEIDRGAIRSARRVASRPVGLALDGVTRGWNALVRDQAVPHRSHDALPATLVSALQRATGAIGDALAEQGDAVPRPLLDLHFAILHLMRLHESHGPHQLVETTIEPAGGPRRRRDLQSRLAIRSLMPAPWLRPRFRAAHASVLFSATLSPAAFHRDTLGLPEDSAHIEVASPFAPDQLAVTLASHVSTRWGDRDASIDPIVDLMAQQYALRPGNYLAFFSSFAYLDAVADRLAVRHPEVAAWSQTPRLDAASRRAFLDRFDDAGTGIGFAVLGGSFGEGIDLPGRRCIGAFVATLGLPPVTPLNEHIRRCMQAAFGAGWEYAYLVPGVQKVVQAAGRVVRTADDRGTVVLIDDRWRRPEVRRLLPSWWSIEGDAASNAARRSHASRLISSPPGPSDSP